MGNNSKIVSTIDATDGGGDGRRRRWPPCLPARRAQEKITEADKIGSEVRGIMLHTNEERGREREKERRRGERKGWIDGNRREGEGRREVGAALTE